jgi:hypothetical protein
MITQENALLTYRAARDGFDVDLYRIDFSSVLSFGAPSSAVYDNSCSLKDNLVNNVYVKEKTFINSTVHHEMDIAARTGFAGAKWLKLNWVFLQMDLKRSSELYVHYSYFSTMYGH